MSKNWYELNIDINDAITSAYDMNLLEQSDFLKKQHSTAGIWTYKQHESNAVLNDEWVKYMESLGFELDVAFTFYRKPHSIMPAHIDCLHNTRDVHGIAINWVLNNNSDSYMAWYNTPPEANNMPLYTTDVYKGHYQLNFDAKELTEIDRAQIGSTPVLVRTDIPHSIEMGDHPRWSISVRFYPTKFVSDKTALLSWDQQIEIMEAFIK
jgi:hypothetical protein